MMNTIINIPNTEAWRNFIDQYKALPVLWDIECKSYKRTACRNKAWLILLEKYRKIIKNATLDALKRRISNIRICYKRENKKVRQSMESGNDVYTPTLWYYKHLDFLDDSKKKVIEKTNTEREALNSYKVKEEILDISNNVTVGNKDFTKSDTNSFQQESTYSVYTQSENQHKSKLIKEKNERDEALIFAEGWACLFRKLTAKQRLYAKKLIDETLFFGLHNKLSIDSAISINNLQHQNYINDEKDYNESDYGDNEDINPNPAEEINVQTPYTDEGVFNETEECNYLVEESGRKHAKKQLEDSKKKNSLECRFCHLILGKLSTKKDHERLHTGEKPYQCNFCGNRFRTTRLRRQHYNKCNETMHVNTADNINNSENILTDCDSKTVIDVHENHSENNTISNDTDIESVSKEQEFQYEELNSKKCKFCGKVFKRPCIRRDHERIHTGEKPYSCEFCKALFSIRTKHAIHVRSCSLNPDPAAKLMANIKRHKCDICNAEFRDRTNFVVHKLRHNGIKKFQCSFCEKRFVSSTEKKIHERYHTNERPFLCTVCGKSFLTNSCYLNHIRRHTGEKLHQCSVCDKAFYKRTQLREHEISHSKERPFVCDICTSAFGSKKRLRAHMKVHDEVGQYVCKICGKVFKQAAGLCGHVKSNHRVIKKTLENVSG